MTGTGSTETMSVAAARAAWVEHRFFKYRGCAPDPTDPRRLAARPDLPVDTHHAADRDGAEPQADRVAREDAAIELCLNCPVMVQCNRYANSITSDGKLAEPEGVWGGRRALERHKALIASRHAAPAAPDRRFQTEQKQSVLRAFAVCWDPYEVAERSGLDVRTANWQRTRMTTDLGLPHDASRAEFLATAVGRGLLAGVVVVADDGSVPAVPPPTRMPSRLAESVASPVPPPVPDPSLVAVSGPEVPKVSAGVGPYEPVRVPRPRRDRFTDIEGQLALWEAELSGLAPVHSLFLATPLEAAA